MDEPTLPLAMQKAYGGVKEELMGRLRRYDQYGNGRVLYSDFVAAAKMCGVEATDEAHGYLQRNFVTRGYVDINKFGAIVEKTDAEVRPSPGSGAAAAGGMTADALRTLVVTKLHAHSSHLNDTFVEMDTNRDGTLSYLEFADGMARLGLELTEAEMAGVLAQHDVRGCGRVSYAEFARFVSDPIGWVFGEHADAGDVLAAKLFPVREELLDALVAADTNYSQTVPMETVAEAVDALIASVPLTDDEIMFVVDKFEMESDGGAADGLIWFLPLVRFVTRRGRELLDPHLSPAPVARAMNERVGAGGAAPHVLHPAVEVAMPALDLLREIVYEAHKHVADAFLEIDADSSGRVSLDEVLAVLAKHYVRPSPAQIAAISADFGAGDGIDYAAFCDFLGQEDPAAAEAAAKHMAVFTAADDAVFDSEIVRSAVAKLYTPGRKLLATILEYSDDDDVALPTLRQALHRLRVKLSHSEFEWVCSKFGSLGTDGAVATVSVPALVHFVTAKGREGLKYGGH